MSVQIGSKSMSKLTWFKHYNTASSGLTLRSLWDSKHYEAFALYWLVLEMVSRWESSDERGKLTVPLSVLSRETGWKQDKLVRELLRLQSDSLSIVFHDQDTTNTSRKTKSVTILISKWLELQEHRGGKRFTKTNQTLIKTPGEGEVRSEKLDTEIEIELELLPQQQNGAVRLHR
jgi:hypothetical protein